MKSKLLFAVAIVALIPGLAFASEKNSATVELDEAVKVAGTQIAPGQYKLSWEGAGPNVTVTFAQGKEAIATAPATLVSSPTSQPQAIETNVSGTLATLTAIDLNHATIRFEQSLTTNGN